MSTTKTAHCVHCQKTVKLDRWKRCPDCKRDPLGREPYNPQPGFWKPRGSRSLAAVKDTAETVLSLEEYKPPRKNRVHPESLASGQWTRERAFRSGYEAQRRGDPRDASHWHEKVRERPNERTASDDVCIAAFELGWDTAAKSSSSNPAA